MGAVGAQENVAHTFFFFYHDSIYFGGIKIKSTALNLSEQNGWLINLDW